MAILRGNEVSLSYGTHVLLDKVNFSIAAGEKIALVGRNGAGKSSLLKLIAGVNQPDGGSIQHQKHSRMRYLAQTLPEADNKTTVFEFVANGVADIRDAQLKYQTLSEEGTQNNQLNELYDFLERTDGWHWEQKVSRVLTRLSLDGDALLAQLSGGWRRRVALAECLASDPDLLLLDEPTNHLDLETIEWLEETLKQFRGSLIVISHDRQFIDALAEQLWEIDRGHVTRFPAPYAEYAEEKEKKLKDEAQHNSEFDKKLAAEETWIRQGIKARRTRNEGRVRALKQLRRERASRREVQSGAKLNIAAGKNSGKLVADIESARLQRAEKTLFSDFTARILKGDKIGIVGPNGCGKSSLIKMILGELNPSEGKVELGTQLNIAYFDQLRSQVNPELTIQENIGEGRDFIEVQGEQRHVISYLSDYGFPPERMRTPASSLSGGEVSRLVLAKLFIRSANLMILDEPTNDLDIETLEMLENQIVEFSGTVLVISHDRRFLDNTATSLFVFEDNDQLVEIAGGYRDLLHYRESRRESKQEKKDVTINTAQGKSSGSVKSKTGSTQASENNTAVNGNKAPANKKLSYKLQRELDGLPIEVEQLETKIAELETQISSAEFQQKTHKEMQLGYQSLSDLQNSLESKFARWEELEDMVNS